MKSNYKRLGNYIVPCDEKNTGNIIKKLQGISNQKYFQKSHTNTIGVDLEKYRIVRTGQFAFNRATTRNGEKISIALRQGKDCIVSPSYRIFKSKDENVLNSEYLMMWFKRPEFDRFARFKSHGSAHEFFDYGEMCEVELPIPSIEKQQEIVREYNTIQNRITLNNQMINKLEETAQAIYKQWFVDFEFPDENGKPYKSNGDKMVWCNELEKEIPEGWCFNEFQKITDVTSGKSLKSEYGNSNPVYGAGGITGYTDDFLFDRTIIIIGRVGTHGKVFIEYNKSWPTDNTLVFTSNYLYYSYFILKELNYDELNKGGVQALLTQADLKQIKILIPNFDLNDFENKVKPILLMKNNIDKQNQKLEELKDLLLAKMTRVEN